MHTSDTSWIKDLELIAWDLDGTLYPSSPDMTELFHRYKLQLVADQLQIPITEATVKFAEVYRQHGSNTAALNALGIDGEGIFLKLWQTIALNEYILPNPELVSKLNQLKKISNIPQAILTNANSQDTVQRKLSCIGIPADFFAAIYTSVEQKVLKPNPAAFTALYANHASNPEGVLYVGDRVETDIQPAAKLGMHTALITDAAESATEIPARLTGKDAEAICDQLLAAFSD